MRLNPIYMSVYVFWSKFIFIEIIPYSLILVSWVLETQETKDTVESKSFLHFQGP